MRHDLRRRCLRGLLAVTAVAGTVGIAGCGGGSASPPVAHAPTAPSHGNSAGGATSSSTTANGAPAAPPSSQAGLMREQLAFAKCMRAHGVPNFPDPLPGGGFQPPHGVPLPVMQAAQAKCQRLLPAGPGSGPPPSPQTLEKVLKISQCMHRHGVAAWPEPRASVPHPLPAGVNVVTDYMGVILLFPSTLDLSSPAVEHAASLCGFALHNH
jgi:hypothetical protein